MVQAGAGIVADSDPAREFAETEAKAQAVLRALAWRSPDAGDTAPSIGVYSPTVFKLLSTSGDQSIELAPGRTLVVGRAVTSDVPIYDPTISRRHAEIALAAGGVRVKDLGSSNGTFLNGARITEADAGANDVVTFGKVAFRVPAITPPARARPSRRPKRARPADRAPSRRGRSCASCP